MFSFTQKASQSGTRRKCFRKDTRLTDSQASLCKHYKYSSFDRGHMAPNGDFDSSDENDEAWMDTYLLSNIAPQYHGFNAGEGKNKMFVPKDDDTHHTIRSDGANLCTMHLGSFIYTRISNFENRNRMRIIVTFEVARKIKKGVRSLLLSFSIAQRNPKV